MNGTKLLELLKTLTPKEVSNFAAYVACEAFNKNEKISTLATLIAKASPSFKEKDISKATVFKKIFPGERYDDVKIRRLISYLYDLLEQYLAILQLKKNPDYLQRLFIHELKEQDSAELQEKYLSQFIEDGEKKNHENADAYYQKYFLYKAQCDFYKKIIDENYLKIQEIQFTALDEYYYTLKLWQLLKKLEYSYSFPIAPDYIQISETLQFITTKHAVIYKRNPLIRLYVKVIGMYLHKDNSQANPVSTEELLKEVDENISKFNAREIRGILFSIAILKSHKASSLPDQYREYQREALAIYKYMSKHKLIIRDDKKIHHGLFLSISTLAIAENELEWASSFVREYEAYLPIEGNENTLNYINGILLHAQKQFQKSIKLLLNVKYESLNIYINTKIILFMNYYELELIDDLYATVNSFSVYINKYAWKLSDNHKDFIENFFSYAKKLFEFKLDKNFRINRNKEEILLLKEKINSNIKNQGSKDWLLLKADELLR